jgi:hypothetical protein
MPYHLRKAPRKNLFWVVNADSGKKYSFNPLPKERAEAQRRAIYASENGYVLRNRSRSRSKRSSPRRSKTSKRSKSVPRRRRSGRRLSGGAAQCVYFTGRNYLNKKYFTQAEFLAMCQDEFLNQFLNYFPDENVDQWNVERWVEETGAEFIKCPPGLF